MSGLGKAGAGPGGGGHQDQGLVAQDLLRSRTGPLDSHLLFHLGWVTPSLWPRFPSIMYIERVGPGDQQGPWQSRCFMSSKLLMLSWKRRSNKEASRLSAGLPTSTGPGAALGFGSTGHAALSWVAAAPSKACNQRIGVHLCAAYGHFQGISGSLGRNVCEQCEPSEAGEVERLQGSGSERTEKGRQSAPYLVWDAQTCFVSKKIWGGL